VFLLLAEFIYTYKSQVSSVDIVTRLWAGQPRNCALAEARDFSLLQIIRDGLWDPPSLLFMDTGDLSPGIKWFMLAAHLQLVLRLGMHGVLPCCPCVSMDWCLIKHRENFTFTHLLTS
jgi:hypothetical protein